MQELPILLEVLWQVRYVVVGVLNVLNSRLPIPEENPTAFPAKVAAVCRSNSNCEIASYLGVIHLSTVSGMID